MPKFYVMFRLKYSSLCTFRLTCIFVFVSLNIVGPTLPSIPADASLCADIPTENLVFLLYLKQICRFHVQAISLHL
jgi:hypothetical protein